MRATCGENGAAALKAEAALSDSRSEGGASERPAAWGSCVLWHKQAGNGHGHRGGRVVKAMHLGGKAEALPLDT